MKNKMKFTLNIVTFDLEALDLADLDLVDLDLVDLVGFEIGIVDFDLMYVFLFVA